jgi:hypothetical protein
MLGSVLRRTAKKAPRKLKVKKDRGLRNRLQYFSAAQAESTWHLRLVVTAKEIAKSMIFEGQMVGVTGIEPVTPTMST